LEDGDDEPSGDSDKEETEVIDLSLNVVANPGSVEPGNVLTWKIVLTNKGNITLSDIHVTDELPDVVLFESSDYGIYDDDSKTVTHIIEELEPGEVFEQNIEVEVPIVANSIQYLLNKVTAVSDQTGTISSNSEIEIIHIDENNDTSSDDQTAGYNPFIYTDKQDYHPGEEVTIFGEGFVPNEDVEIIIKDAEGETEHTAILGADDAGNFVYKYSILGSPSYTVEANSIIENEKGKTEFLDSVTATYKGYSWDWAEKINNYVVGLLWFNIDHSPTEEYIPAYCVDQYIVGLSNTNYYVDYSTQPDLAAKPDVQNIANNYPVVKMQYSGTNYELKEVASAIQRAIWHLRTGAWDGANQKDALAEYMAGHPNR